MANVTQAQSVSVEEEEALTEPLGTAMLRTILRSQARRPPAPESRAQRSRWDLERISTPPAGGKAAAARSARRTAAGAGRGGAIGGGCRGGEEAETAREWSGAERTGREF